MYESPISLIERQMRTEIENYAFKAVQEVGIVVDKEELIKALQYDREQFEKGYKDGYSEGYAKGVKDFADRLKAKADSGFWHELSYVSTEDICDLEEEMTEQ